MDDFGFFQINTQRIEVKRSVVEDIDYWYNEVLYREKLEKKREILRDLWMQSMDWQDEGIEPARLLEMGEEIDIITGEPV